MKNFDVFENYQNMTQKYEVSTCYCKNDANRLAQCRIEINLQFVRIATSSKHNKVNHYKGR